MEFWLIIEGEKEGPILDFELRSRIRNGEVSAEQKVWHSAVSYTHLTLPTIYSV